jgi:hypothetical protein
MQRSLIVLQGSLNYIITHIIGIVYLFIKIIGCGASLHNPAHVLSILYAANGEMVVIEINKFTLSSILELLYNLIVLSSIFIISPFSGCPTSSEKGRLDILILNYCLVDSGLNQLFANFCNIISIKGSIRKLLITS